jgi:hypothetical protein
MLTELDTTHPFFYGIIRSAETALFGTINQIVLWIKVRLWPSRGDFPLSYHVTRADFSPETDIIVFAFVSGYPSNSASLEFVRVMGFIPNLDSSRV